MKDNVITINQELFDDLYAANQELAKLRVQLKQIETKKADRAESYKRVRKINPDEKKFGAIMRAANRSLKSQVYKDPQTLKQLIKLKIKDIEEYMFYAILKNRVSAVVGMEDFVNFCEEHELNKNAVAQHVVICGEKKTNEVFKYGLGSVFKPEKLDLMNVEVFTDEELNLEQYKPKKHQ
ncbi:hypothetical protein INQ51_12890 [Maribellus sp. CM-23]|uniref:hypothetical protein n=1 Tax=Maribellus sp. CM-23 TaxID=2781026 RepID=UPI001F3D87AB|nr:hypothetical protein [Maribellus sp. CM-23]MCE4565207.1 hypothetical protein [Maribellus sp. CM-23]